MKSVLIFFIFTVVCISCHESVDFKSFKKTIIDTSSYQEIQRATKILNYSSLENGVDSFELRLWTVLGHTDLKEVKILKYDDSNWHLSETRYWIRGDSTYPKRGSKIFLDSGVIEYTKLIIPIQSLLDTLYTLNLDTLPNQIQIPGFKDHIAGGYYYNLELATKGYYKLLSYHEPEQYSDKYNKTFCRILGLLWTKKN